DLVVGTAFRPGRRLRDDFLGAEVPVAAVEDPVDCQWAVTHESLHGRMVADGTGSGKPWSVLAGDEEDAGVLVRPVQKSFGTISERPHRGIGARVRLGGTCFVGRA